MITNILLGLILIALIIIICGRQEKHTITMFIQENEKMNIPNTIEVVDLRDPVGKLPDCKDEVVQDCLLKEAEHNPVVKEKTHRIAGLPTHEDYPITYVREQVKQTPSKLRVTDIHLAILDKVSQSEGAFETSFKHDVNELFIKRKEWGVALEFEKDKPICYTIRKGDSTRDVIYLDQVERWLGVDKKNKDRTNNSVKSPKYYNDKVKQYIEIKRATLKGDVAVLKEVGLSAKALKMYEEPYKEEINKLRDACRQKHIEALKAKYPPKAPKGAK